MNPGQGSNEEHTQETLAWVAMDANNGDYTPLLYRLGVSKDVLSLWLAERLTGEEMVRRALAHKV